MIDAGRQLLANASFDDRNSMSDFYLLTIANACLIGSRAESAARSLCREAAHRKGLSDYTFTAYRHDQLLQALFKLQPRIALDVFFDKQNGEESKLSVDDFDAPSDRRKNPLDEVPQALILDWCNERPTER